MFLHTPVALAAESCPETFEEKNGKFLSFKLQIQENRLWQSGGE